ncbi:MAG: DUF1572 family protein [Bacteroidota bacterium]
MDQEFLSDIRHIILRDLRVVRDEVIVTPDGNLWRTIPGIANSVGTLALHLCGNLRHFVGASLAHDGYLRDRDAEFNSQDLTKSELLQILDDSIFAIDRAFDELDPEMLDQSMPNPPAQHSGRSIRFFLIQLSCHLSRHTGQMNYLRRMLCVS